MGFGLNLYELVRIPISRRCNGYYLRWYYNGWHYWLWHPGRIGFITEGEKYRTLGTQILTIGSGQITEEQVRSLRTIKNTREINIYTDSGWGVVRLIPGSVITYNNQIHGYEVEITIIIGSKQISKDGFSPAISIPVVDPSYEYCETMCIGDQVWMCKNYDSNYPGNRVYNNDEDNRVEYGGLYKHSQVMASGFVPAGWKVPTIAEWTTLITECGGVLDAGGELKEIGTDHWLTAGGLGTYGFSAVGGGRYGFLLGVGTQYHYLKTYGFFWAQDGFIRMDHDSAAITVGAGIILPNEYYSVRLLSTGICVPYAGSGILYNWYIAATNIAPAGWHVPTQAEFNTLATTLGGNMLAGGYMKEAGYVHWNSPNTGANNLSGFTGLGTGYRYHDGNFYSIKVITYYWTSEEISESGGYYALLFYDHAMLYQSDSDKHYGSSLRLIKDDNVDPGTMTDYDGNIYPTIKIGNQVWMKSNLKVTHLNDGTPILDITDGAAWALCDIPARCWFNNIPE